MLHIIAGLMTIFASLSMDYVHADPSNASANVPACLFDDVLAFGASVTSATAAVPAYDVFVRAMEDWGRLAGTYVKPKDAPKIARPYGLSPVRYLIKNYVGKRGLDRLTNIGKYVTREDEHLGSSQAEAMMSGIHKAKFDRASLVVGVDAFYWDAVWKTCGPSLDRIILNLIAKSRDAGKVLILGSVPIEDPLKVRIDSDRTGVGIWWPPDVECATHINAVLRTYCTSANRCYVVDLKATVDRLNAGEKLPLRDGGTYGLYDMRPDGVHLSDKGTRYIAELMIAALEAQPVIPRCAVHLSAALGVGR